MSSRRRAAGLGSAENHPGGAERYPSAGEGAGGESFLPSHPMFRSELGMALPRTVAGDHVSIIQSGRRKKQKMTPAQVVQSINSKTEEIIEELSGKDKFLPSDVLRNIVMDQIQRARSQHAVNISFRDVAVFTEFSRLHGRIDELIKVYCMFTPVTSLHELGIALAYAEKVSSYEELHLGPLIKHPRVRDYFKPPEDVECAPEITVHQLHGCLTKLVDKSKRGNKLLLEDYLEFVRKKQCLESAAHLCVRIQSFPLMIQVLKIGCSLVWKPIFRTAL